MRKFDNKELQREVKKFWETNPLPFELVRSLDFPEDGVPSTIIKVKSEAFEGFEGFGWVKPAAMSAYELTFGAFKFLRKYVKRGSRAVLYQTTESLVAPFILGAEHFAEADKYATAYYNGNVDSNPPQLDAWLTLHIEPTDRLEAKTYTIDSDGESLDF